MFNKKSLKRIEAPWSLSGTQTQIIFFVFQCYFRNQEPFNPVNREISIFFTGQTDDRQTDGQMTDNR